MHQCLVEKKDKLTEKCKAEVAKLQILQSSNIELKPTVAKACAEERQVHCSGVRPGKSRVFNCLLSKADKVDFSTQCKNLLQQQEEKRVKDWRLDYTLRQACRYDVPSVCAGVLSKENKEDGAVFKCLVQNTFSVSDDCGQAISYAVHVALQFYRTVSSCAILWCKAA